MQSVLTRNPAESDAGRGPGDGFDKLVLGTWMQCMEDYGQVWREDFGRTFFSAPRCGPGRPKPGKRG